MARVLSSVSQFAKLACFLSLIIILHGELSEAQAAGPCGDGKFADGPFCYSCDGYNRTAEPVSSKRSCSKWVQPHQAMVKRGSATAGIICPLGQWQWAGQCFSCPSGWLTTPFVAPTDSNACWQPGRNEYKQAQPIGGEPYCGFEGGRACNIWEHMPSCGTGLFEHNGKCEPLPPGKDSAFLASIDIWSKEASKAGKDYCTAAIVNGPDPIPFPLLKNTSAEQIRTDLGSCVKNYEAGFVCEIPTMLNTLGNMSEVLNRFGSSFDRKPCTVYRDANAPTLQLACAVAEGLGVKSAVNLAACAYDTFLKIAATPKMPPLEGAENSTNYDKQCRSAGKLTFKVAEFFAGRELGKALDAAPQTRIVKIAETFKDIYDTMGMVTTLESIKDGLATVPSCAVYNDPAPIDAQAMLPKMDVPTPKPVSKLPPPVAVPYVPLVTEQNSIVQFRNVANPRCLSQASTERTQSYVRDCDTGSEAQTWVVERRKGFFTLRSQHSWQCLTHSGNETQPGYTTIQTPCDLQDEKQHWSIRPAHGYGNAVTISPYMKRSLCLATGSDGNGAKIPYENCNADRSPQRWNMNSFGNLDRWMFQFEQDNRCMAQGGSFEDGRQVFQWDCGTGADSTNWTWMREPVRDKPGFYYLRNMTSGKCLDLSGHKSDNQTPIQQWQCSKNNPGQMWELAGVSRGDYPLQLRTYLYQDWNPRRCVTLKGNGKGNNTPFWEWGCSEGNDHGQYGKNDKFKMIPVRTKQPLWIEWTSTGFKGIDISIGGGKAWAIGADQLVYRWNGSSWEHMGGGGAKRLDVGPDGNPVVIGWQDTLWGWNPAKHDFVQLPGKASDVTIGSDNRMYMISAEDGQVYEWYEGSKSWVRTKLREYSGIAFANIDADGFGNLWALTKDGSNIFYNLRVGQTSIPGLAYPLANSVGTSSDGAVWATGVGGEVVQWVDNVAKEVPAYTDGMKFKRIEGSVRGWVWAIRDNGEIYYGEVL